jgi:type II secretory pathway pseudopilin PulG
MWQRGEPVVLGKQWMSKSYPDGSVDGLDNTQGARRSDRAGFTLVEMAFVAMIILIVVAVAIPRVIQYIRMYRVGIASRNVATALQRARYLATSDNTRAEASIRRDAAMIDILEYSADGTGEPLQKGLVTLPPDIIISPNAPRKIAFDGRGVVTPLPKESPVIEVDGVNGFFSTVTVSLTGQVTVSNITQRK